MSLKKSFFLSSLAVLLYTVTASPCSWDPMLSYFGDGDAKDLYFLPETHFDSEYMIITDQTPDLEAEEQYMARRWQLDGDYPNYLWRFALSRQRVLEIEQAELEEILGDHPEKELLIEEYVTRRRLLNGQSAQQIDRRVHEEQQWDYSGEGAKDPNPDEIIALVENCPPEIPAEYRHYLRGVAAFILKDYEGARSLFEAVLLLPAEERAHKTLWAVYMSARCSIDLMEMEGAQAGFEQCRQLVQEGFKDPLDLLTEAIGWLGGIYLSRGDYVQALHAYVNYRSAPEKWNKGKESLVILFRDALKNAGALQQMAQDDLARQLMTAWLTSQPYPPSNAIETWLQITGALSTDGLLAGADRLAWLAYHAGEMEQAVRWLKQSEESSVPGRFVQGKLLLREGKLDEATALLQTLSDEMSRNRLLYFEGDYPRVAGASIRSAEAAALLLKKDYKTAIKQLAPVYKEDAEFLAARLLTLDELEDVLRELQEADPEEIAETRDGGDFFNEASYQPGYSEFVAALYKIYAQRLVRHGDWERAAQAFKESVALLKNEWEKELFEETYEAALEIAALLQRARDDSLSERERAQAYVDAGPLAFKYGSELVGEWGLFEEPGFEALADNARSVLPDDAEERMENTKNLCGRTFSFRFIASNWMRRAAGLLPDNDPLTARALFLGGSYLKARYPKEADDFYKDLVRRNPNLLIAKQADELRWFPENFTDEVLYTPREASPRIRMLDMAVLIVRAVVILAALGTLIWVLRRKPENDD
jgi:tetratricopeptide (TPR) repeat protein